MTRDQQQDLDNTELECSWDRKPWYRLWSQDWAQLLQVKKVTVNDNKHWWRCIGVLCGDSMCFIEKYSRKMMKSTGQLHHQPPQQTLQACQDLAALYSRRLQSPFGSVDLRNQRSKPQHCTGLRWEINVVNRRNFDDGWWSRPVKQINRKTRAVPCTRRRIGPRFDQTRSKPDRESNSNPKSSRHRPIMTQWFIMIFLTFD